MITICCKCQFYRVYRFMYAPVRHRCVRNAFHEIDPVTGEKITAGLKDCYECNPDCMCHFFKPKNPWWRRLFRRGEA
jgi:hypothetical protein